MRITFDEATADLLITTANRASSALARQGALRRSAAETASEDFRGAYAELFTAACVAESEDRGKLAGVLADLVPQINNAKLKAQEEKDRLSHLADWTAREEARERSRASSLPGTFEATPDFYDPKPSETPVTPPTIYAAFSPRDRTHSPGARPTGSSPADPPDLIDWVAASSSANREMQEHLSNMRTVWTRFISDCSWTSTDAASLIPGFEMLIELNDLDADWIERIAAAFDLAGSGGIFTPSDPINDALLGTASEAFARYRGRLRIPGGNAEVPEELLRPMTKDAGWLKEFDRGTWYSINPETGFRAPVGSWGAVPPTPEVLRPKGWYDRHVFTPNGKFGIPPSWARWGGKGLGALGGSLTLWGAYADSYNESLKSHPDWEEHERTRRASEDTLIIGGSSIGGSMLAGIGAGAVIGSVIPGPGTAVGAIVGVVAGLGAGVLGGLAGEQLGEEFSDWYHGESEGEILAPGPTDQPAFKDRGLA